MVSPPTSTTPIPPLWRTTIHLTSPLLTALLILLFSPLLATSLPNLRTLDFRLTLLLVFLCALPTHHLATLFYSPPSNLATTVRFSRIHIFYRALTLLLYGRLYGTPFNPLFFAADLLLSYPLGYIIGERPPGTLQRRSEFGVALLWVVGSSVVGQVVPRIVPVAGFWLLVLDRAVWRAAWVALVDDVVGVLGKPSVENGWGAWVKVVGLQGLVIVGCVGLGLRVLGRMNSAGAGAEGADAGADDVGPGVDAGARGVATEG